MVFFFDHMVGDNDFASNFASVAEEKREAEERRQAEFILKLLDELEKNADSGPSKDDKFERMVAIDDEGYIYDTKDQQEQKRKQFHNKVHTLKDLPYESEWEQIFGPQPEPEPAYDIKKGRRVIDGRKVHMLKPNSPEAGKAVYWTGMSPITMFILASTILCVTVLLLKLIFKKSPKKAVPIPDTKHQLRMPVFIPRPVPIQQQISMSDLDTEINKRVKFHVRQIMNAEDFK